MRIFLFNLKMMPEDHFFRMKKDNSSLVFPTASSHEMFIGEFIRPEIALM